MSKCPVCANVNHLNFGQKEMMAVKAEMHAMKQYRRSLAFTLKLARERIRAEEEKLQVLRGFQNQVEKEIGKRLDEMTAMSKTIKNELSKK